MSKSATIKTINIRLEEDLWTTCKEIASERHQSFNKFAEEALAKAADERRRSRLRAAFQDLAKQVSDVEFAFQAQSEVVLGSTEPTAS